MSTQSDNVPRRIEIDPRNVPEPFRPLIPYAEKWSISDDADLIDRIDAASPEELRELVKAVAEFDAEGFDEWLGNPGANNDTKEWRAFILLVDAHDFAKMRLQSNDE